METRVLLSSPGYPQVPRITGIYHHAPRCYLTRQIDQAVRFVPVSGPL